MDISPHSSNSSGSRVAVKSAVRQIRQGTENWPCNEPRGSSVLACAEVRGAWLAGPICHGVEETLAPCPGNAEGSHPQHINQDRANEHRATHASRHRAATADRQTGRATARSARCCARTSASASRTRRRAASSSAADGMGLRVGTKPRGVRALPGRHCASHSAAAAWRSSASRSAWFRSVNASRCIAGLLGGFSWGSQVRPDDPVVVRPKISTSDTARCLLLNGNAQCWRRLPALCRISRGQLRQVNATHAQLLGQVRKPRRTRFLQPALEG